MCETGSILFDSKFYIQKFEDFYDCSLNRSFFFFEDDGSKWLSQIHFYFFTAGVITVRGSISFFSN